MKGQKVKKKILAPYAEIPAFRGHHSPYYNDSHKAYKKVMREYMETEIIPNTIKWDENGLNGKEIWPKGLHKQLYEKGLYCGAVGFWPTKYAGDNIAGGVVKPDQWDYFHEMIGCQEIARCGSFGVSCLLSEGITLGLPPLLHFGSKKLQDKICATTLKGEKMICLAITEPYAGSDVAGIQCTAVKSDDGSHYIVNGEKKWITGGTFADYFTVAVRTSSKKGMGGISLLLIERDFGGVSTKHMKCSGLWASGTAFINFKDCKVPVENLIGKENEGFKYVMYNFNHERFMIISQTIAFARLCYEEAFTFVNQRKAFGKKLIENPVVRNKLGHMIRKVESAQAWLETITYQLNKMSHLEAMMKLGGEIALLKAHSTIVFEYCAREGSMLFGGLSYSRGGRGGKIETLYRDAKSMAILGGSEDVMIDLGVKMALKEFNRSKL